MIQADSGGGKSWAVRRILEQSHGKVQQINLDSEGEFGTLREKYDYILAGKGGEAPADLRSAALLARKLLELKVSAIIDVYELHPQQRKHFVRLLLDSLINAPKELWHDCIVVIDEAHTYAPEKGQSEAMDAVIGLCALGRKRGFPAILATQRISKLHKDAAAECNNKLIGRFSQDIDMKRGADELGFTSREQMLSLRALKPGEFDAFGPAISDEVQMVTVGPVGSTHPKAGSRSLTEVVPPTAGIKKILGKLADLPQEAAKEAQTVAELKAEIARLKKQSPQPTSVSDADDQKRIAELEAHVSSLQSGIRGWVKYACDILWMIDHLHDTADKATHPDGKPIDNYREIPKPQVVKPVAIRKTSTANSPLNNESGQLSGPEQRILDAIAWMKSIGVSGPEQTAVAFLAGYTFGGGGFNNPKGRIRSKGLLEYRGDCIALTEAGCTVAHLPQEILTTEALHQKVLERLPGPERRLLTVLLESYPNEISNEELAERSGYTHGAGGFDNPRGRLRSLGLIEYLPGGKVKAKSLLLFRPIFN